jgi:hypothetical protein
MFRCWKAKTLELQDPALNGEDLSYTVNVLQGDPPAKADDVSV